jgi:hypothetical protein
MRSSLRNDGDRALIICIDPGFRTLRGGEVEKEHIRSLTPRSDIAHKWAGFIQENLGQKSVGSAKRILGLHDNIARQGLFLAQNSGRKRDFVWGHLFESLKRFDTQACVIALATAWGLLWRANNLAPCRLTFKAGERDSGYRP